jgi:hypothetical protein
MDKNWLELIFSSDDYDPTSNYGETSKTKRHLKPYFQNALPFFDDRETFLDQSIFETSLEIKNIELEKWILENEAFLEFDDAKLNNYLNLLHYYDEEKKEMQTKNSKQLALEISNSDQDNKEMEKGIFNEEEKKAQQIENRKFEKQEIEKHQVQKQNNKISEALLDYRSLVWFVVVTKKINIILNIIFI